MSAHPSTGRAVGRAILVLLWMTWASCAPGTAQQLVTPSTEQPRSQIAALAERLAVQLLAANKKKPFILDLTLPNDLPCPLGAWLADRISESLTETYPQLGVIARTQWSSARESVEFAHDKNQEYLHNQQRAQSLGAEVLVSGNFAAVPEGIGITLIASDVLAGGESRFEALAEIPITSEMQAVLTSPLPQRPVFDGAPKASVAGIGSPVCQVCPVTEYSYVAKAQKLKGVVIAQVMVNADGIAGNIKVVHTPNEALAAAAMRAVHGWRFRPARNSKGELVPVVVDVAVSFRLDIIPATTVSAGRP